MAGARRWRWHGDSLWPINTPYSLLSPRESRQSNSSLKPCIISASLGPWPSDHHDDLHVDTVTSLPAHTQLMAVLHNKGRRHDNYIQETPSSSWVEQSDLLAADDRPCANGRSMLKLMERPT